MKNVVLLGLEYYKKYKEVFNYLVFGVIATVINIGVFAFLNWKLGKELYLLSNTIAILAAVLFQYFTNKFLVFEYEKKSKKETLIEFGKFMSCRGITYVIDMAMMYIGVDILKVAELLMKIITNVVVIILNYIFSKFLVFTKKKEKNLKEDSVNN